MATLTYDPATKSSASITPDNRSNAGSLSIDNKTAGSRLIWVSTYFPWIALTLPWSTVPENILTKDIRN